MVHGTFLNHKKKLMVHIRKKMKKLRLHQKHLMKCIKTVLLISSGPTEEEQRKALNNPDTTFLLNSQAVRKQNLFERKGKKSRSDWYYKR